ncbi:REP-associated tyrosine transposase [Massilia litorea]|nr:transposase [Massilia litorea]
MTYITARHARIVRALALIYDRAMSRYRRALTGSTFFFTLVAYRRRPILCDDVILRALRGAILAVRSRRPFTIDAWVQLPDHLHCIWTLPQDDTNFSRRWSEIKHHVSYACHGMYDGPALSQRMKRSRLATIWQPRFWEHRIRDERDLSQHVDYIHINPVRHGHAQHASLWPYSSFARYVRNGIYPADWCGPVDETGLCWE